MDDIFPVDEGKISVCQFILNIAIRKLSRRSGKVVGNHQRDKTHN